MGNLPTYTPLAADPNARRHVLVTDRSGLESARRVSIELEGLGLEPEVLVLGLPPDWKPRTRHALSVFSSVDPLCYRLDALLSEACMGMRLYIAGSESFVWAVNEVAVEHGLREEEIRREACGQTVRRVLCVHCRALIEAVDAATVSCPGCGRSLEVRDHFSPRLGAYLGLSVMASDAEETVR